MTGSPDAAQRVVLHVGTPKSGTTFLQRALWRHQPELDAVGVTCAGRRHFEMFHAAIELRGSYEFWGRTPRSSKAPGSGCATRPAPTPASRS